MEKTNCTSFPARVQCPQTMVFKQDAQRRSSDRLCQIFEHAHQSPQQSSRLDPKPDHLRAANCAVCAKRSTRYSDEAKFWEDKLSRLTNKTAKCIGLCPLDLVLREKKNCTRSKTASLLNDQHYSSNPRSYSTCKLGKLLSNNDSFIDVGLVILQEIATPEASAKCTMGKENFATRCASGSPRKKHCNNLKVTIETKGFSFLTRSETI